MFEICVMGTYLYLSFIYIFTLLTLVLDSLKNENIEIGYIKDNDR